MDNITSYLVLIPDVVWAAVIASALTLTGVMMTNRHYTKQQTTQLEHKKSENEAERKHDLRQSVYLPAVEELTLAQQHLMKLSTMDLAKENPADKLTSFFVASTKASLVASDETAKLIGDVLSEYSKIFFNLLAKASPIQRARTDRDLANDAYEKYNNEVSRILVSMTQFNEEAKANSVIWNALNRNLEYNMKQADISANERNEAWNKFNRLTAEFSLNAYTEARPLGDLVVTAIAAMRSELGIPSNIEVYRAEFQARYSQMKEQLEKFIAGVRKDDVD